MVWKAFLGGQKQQASMQEMYTALRNAGFNDSTAIDMTAIGMAESGGVTNGVNEIGAAGTWQIFDGGIPNLARWTFLSDLNNNAHEAFVKYQGGGYCPWAVYSGPG